MITLILSIANIAGGVLLGIATLDKWDGDSNFFNKIAGVLAPFQPVIGGTLVILAVLRILGGHLVLFNCVSLLGGFLLLTHAIGQAPAFRSALKKVSDALTPFKAIIGIALIVVGLISVF